MTTTIQTRQVVGILTGLIGKDVTVQVADSVDVHPATMRGLVTNENQLVAVIGSDLHFAHRSGGALAMIPTGMVEEKGDDPDEELILVYREVANVLSRLVDEAAPVRVRLDPGLEHPVEDLQAILAVGTPILLGEVGISGYGSGRFGVWYQG